MMRRFAYLSALAVAAALAAPASGVAASPTQAPPGVTSPRQNSAGVEQHIQQLHSQLRITPAQQGQWEQFAEVMRQNARNMMQALDQRAAQIGSMNAVQDMQSYSQLASQHAQDMQKLSDAFQTLYGSLSEQQRQEADVLFRERTNRAAHQHGSNAG